MVMIRTLPQVASRCSEAEGGLPAGPAGRGFQEPKTGAGRQMLVIRDVTADALDRAAYDDFVARMRVHLRKFLPEQCDALGEIKTGQLIEFGVKRARECGFEAERDVCKYIDLMCVFGHSFDRDERLPWARQILESRVPPDPGERMRRLHDAALEALRKRYFPER